jgi:hypothetical protein
MRSKKLQAYFLQDPDLSFPIPWLWQGTGVVNGIVLEDWHIEESEQDYIYIPFEKRQGSIRPEMMQYSNESPQYSHVAVGLARFHC